MSGYSIISVLALICYLFLLVAFLASKKTRLIYNFIFLLTTLLLWTLGSFFMRSQIPPSATLWFYVSIDGLFLMVYAYYSFLTEYMNAPKSPLRYVWRIGWALIILLNHLTGGCFIGAPKVIQEGLGLRFVYDIPMLIIVPFIFTAMELINCILITLAYRRRTPMGRGQITPIFIGMAFLVFGNVAASFPLFASFPIDILCGIVNAFCIFYALYNRRLFQLTLLVNRSALLFVSGLLAVILFTYTTGSNSEVLLSKFSVFGKYSIMAISVMYSLSVLLLYFILKKFADNVFIRNEIARADNLREFSRSISKTLKVNDILTQMIEIITDSLHTEKVYICLKNENQTDYRIVSSSSPLDGKGVLFDAKHPLVRFLAASADCIMMEDLRRLPIYKAMWDREKHRLSNLNIQVILPLISDNDLIGLALLSGKDKGIPYSMQDLGYLQSLSTVSSVAIKNSWLYEKAYREARTDSLTGLLNRKYFYSTLEELCEQHPGEELSLIYISLDSFKLYNKLYGSLEGDHALKNVAQIIEASVGSNGICARYEGKTFMVILPGFDTLSAIHLADVIRKQVLDMNSRAKDYSLKMLTCSCGVCSIPTGASNAEQLISNADLALYNAKRGGKNCTRSHSQGPAGTADSQTLRRSPTEYEERAFKASAFDQYEIAINSLTKAIDIKDHFTYGHSQNVCYYATELAKAYGLDADCIEIVREAALLHDIGKIGIDERILRKPGRLTEDEYAIMKGHVEQSIEIIKQLPSLSYVIPAVTGHHERYDGKGYPRGLKGEEIPLLARILCVVDSFDAMISRRSYKAPLPIDYALGELMIGRGTQFDPDLASLFNNLVREGTITIQKFTE